MDFSPRVIQIDAIVTEAVRFDATERRPKAAYSVTLNTPYGFIGGYLNGTDAAKIYEAAILARNTSNGQVTVQLMPVWAGKGSAKGFVDHLHKLEIRELLPYSPGRSRPSA